MPCTTIELGEAQIEPGKPRYPLKAGSAPCERISFSAARSSSSVVTPGRALASSMCRQRTRISPAAAILSTCSGVLRMIILYTLVPSSWNSLNRLVGLEPQGRQGALDLVGDRVRRRRTIDLAQQ